jgi:hypothetical protein
VGGGSGWKAAKEYARDHRLANVKCFPYQPLELLSASLSAADLHVVVMGDPFVGIVHPCKIYNVLACVAQARMRPTPASPADSSESRPGQPGILYIGPKSSHIMDLLEQLPDPAWWSWARHRDVGAVMRCVLGRQQALAELRLGESGMAACSELIGQFSMDRLLPQLIARIET